MTDEHSEAKGGAHRVTQQQARETLTAYAEGRLAHLGRGSCPDALEGYASRDPACPVCRALNAQHPDTQGEAASTEHGQPRVLDEPAAEDGLRRALLALADEFDSEYVPAGAEPTTHGGQLRAVLRVFDKAQRTLIARGSPSVGNGSSDEREGRK